MVKRTVGRIFQSRDWVVVVVLALLVTLLRWPSLEQPFGNDGGANAYHARLIVRGEPLYSTHHPAHHMPAVYYTYALAFLLFGDSVWAVKFLLIPWTVITAYLLYRLGVLLMDRATGLLAAIFYAILSADVFLYGSTAETELFANLPRTAAVLVLTHLLIRQSAAWKFVSVGLLSAAAFLFKAAYLSPLAMVGLALFVELWQTRRTAGAWRTPLIRGLWVGVGFVSGLLPVVAYFGLLGLFPRFLLVFTIGREYVNFRHTATAAQPYWLLHPLLGLASDNIALLILGLTGLVMIVITALPRYRDQRSNGALLKFCIAFWYVLSYIEAGITRVVFLHYYLLITPPLALLAAWFLLRTYHVIKHQFQPANRFVAVLVLTTLLTITLSFSLKKNCRFYNFYLRYKFGAVTYRDFLLRGWSEHNGAEFVRIQELADYIQKHTSLSDYIYYWSGGVQLYYQANRRCPIDMIWPLYAEATGPYQRIFVPQTKYVIVGESNNVSRPGWLYAELAKNYTLETVIKDQELYRRVD
jgi:hypothetical protein